MFQSPIILLLVKIVSRILVKVKENIGLIRQRIQDQAVIKYLLCLTNIKENLKKFQVNQ